MSKVTFYEQVGIVIPGALLLVGLLLLFPIDQVLDEVSVGEFGVFFLLSYAAGHLVAAMGNVGEFLAWKLSGGMPTQWILKPTSKLVSPAQRTLIVQRIKSRLSINVETLDGHDRRAWWPLTRQLYADVMCNGRPDRIDTFNGNYGLNRGLASAALVLGVVAMTQEEWAIGLMFLVGGVIFAYRAYRFGVHYARELFVQFLALPAELKQETKVSPKRKAAAGPGEA